MATKEQISEKYGDKIPALIDAWCSKCMFWHVLTIPEVNQNFAIVDSIWCQECRRWYPLERRLHCKYDLLPCGNDGRKCIYWKAKE